MSELLRIRDWQKHFENNRTKELRSMTWVPIPNKHDGDGFTELVVHENGAAHFGAWVLILQVASKCDPRGTLLRDGSKPHDSASLARITRVDRSIFDEAIPRLIEIGWLESVPFTQQDVNATPHGDATKPHTDAAASQESAPIVIVSERTIQDSTSESEDSAAPTSDDSFSSLVERSDSDFGEVVERAKRKSNGQMSFRDHKKLKYAAQEKLAKRNDLAALHREILDLKRQPDELDKKTANKIMLLWAHLDLPTERMQSLLAKSRDGPLKPMAYFTKAARTEIGSLWDIY